MNTLLEKLMPLMSAEGGGGAAGGGAAPGSAAGQLNPSADGSGGGGGGQAGDGGGNPPAPSTPSGPYRPEGLPETMYGKDDKETIDKLAQALRGYRERDSQRQIPETPDAYRSFKLDDVPDAIRPHIDALAKDPLFEAVAKVAHEEKVPVTTLQKLTASLYAQAAEMGLLDHVIDVEKERAALLPENAKHLPKAQQDQAINARLQANEDWLRLQVQHGLPKEVAEHGLLMLMDTALGNQLIEYFRDRMTGSDRDQPLAGEAARGKDSLREQLRKRLGAPEMQPDHPNFSQEAYTQLMTEYRRVIGD